MIRKRSIYVGVFETPIFVHQCNINWKDLQMDPIGTVRSHLPSGHKGFRRFEKGRFTLVFLKPQFSFTNAIEIGKTFKWNPSGECVRTSLRGINIIECCWTKYLGHRQKLSNLEQNDAQLPKSSCIIVILCLYEICDCYLAFYCRKIYSNFCWKQASHVSQFNFYVCQNSFEYVF